MKMRGRALISQRLRKLRADTLEPDLSDSQTSCSCRQGWCGAWGTAVHVQAATCSLIYDLFPRYDEGNDVGTGKPGASYCVVLLM